MKSNQLKKTAGSRDYIDVIKDNDPGEMTWFYYNLSDHYPVVLNIDVSPEQ